MTEELRQRNIEVGLISERPPSCMSDNDGDSRAGWMKEVLVDSLGDHDEQTRWLAFDHKLRGDSRALYIKDCTAGDVTPVTFCHLILVVYSSNLSITWSLSTGCSLTQEVASECRQHGQHSQHSLMFEWVIAFFDKSSKYTFFLFIYKESINRVAYIFPLPRSSWHV